MKKQKELVKVNDFKLEKLEKRRRLPRAGSDDCWDCIDGTSADTASLKALCKADGNVSVGIF